MALQFDSPLRNRSARPTAELAFVVAALVAAALWEHLTRTYVLPGVGFGPGGYGYAAFDSILIPGVVTGTVLLVGVAAVAGVYVTARDVDVGGLRPAGGMPTVTGAAIAPVALVALTKLVAAATGTTYGALFQRSYGAPAGVEMFVTTTVLMVFLLAPMLLLVCQVIVQGGLRRVVADDAVVPATTLVTGFLLVDATGGLEMLPEPGTLVGAALFVVAMAVAQCGSARFEAPRLRYLAFVPAAVLIGLTVVTGVAAVETVPAVLFLGVKVAVLGVAAAAYQRTGSLLAPLLTYASFLATSEVVVYLFEAGVQSL